MSNKVQTMSSFLQSGVPKVTIQRILLESGLNTLENKSIKDPHFELPDSFKASKDIMQTKSYPLRVSLTLSIQGLKKKNFKNNPLKNIFHNLDIMSLTRTTVYEISRESIEYVESTAAAVNLLSALLGVDGFGSDLTLQEVLQIVEKYPQEFNIRQFNLLEEMTSATNNSETDLSRYENTLSDGSVAYNFPIRLSPYSHTNENPGFLAYLTVTEIDSELLLNHIKSNIGGNSNFELPTAVEEYIKTLNSEISNKGVSLDVVFNQGGDANQFGTLLQRTDTKEFWFGPYHPSSSENGVFISGNKYNDPSLDPKDRNIILEPVLLPNTKIVDLRDDEEIEKVLLKELYQLENINNVLSDVGSTKSNNTGHKVEKPEKYSISYKSVDGTGSPSYLFGIDKLNVLMSNSLLAGIAENLKAGFFTGVGDTPSDAFINALKAGQIVKEVLENTNVKQLKVFRKRIQTNNFGDNRLGTLKAKQESFMNLVLDADIENSYFDSINTEVCSYTKDLTRDTNQYSSIGIEKLDGFNFLNDHITEKKYLFFSFRDSSLPGLQSGDYEYSYELMLEDGILKTLTNKLQILMNFRPTIKAYVNLINGNLKSYYDDVQDKFNTDAIAATSFNNIEDTINDILQVIEEIILLFKLDAKTEAGIEKLYKISNPMFGNYQGLLKFVAIYETFIEKIQKISGLNTSILKHVDKSTSLQKNYGEPRNTIKIDESFLDVATLDNRNTGYEFILSSFAKLANSENSSETIQQIPVETFVSMADQEFKRYFSENDSNTSTLGNINNINKVRYFTPTLTYMPGKTYSTTTGPTPELSAPEPWTRDFNYYKPIILDILEYYIFKKVDKFSSQETKNNLRRLINIASNYGMIFDDVLFRQLGFLADPTNISNENEGSFTDTSQAPNQQQQFGQNSNFSGFNIDTDDDPGSEYEDTSLLIQFNPNVENFLFALLSNIILEEEGMLPPLYNDPQLSPGSANVLAGNVSELPFPIQSLFVEHNSKLASLKQYLNGTSNIPFDVVKEFPLSLSTFGWWWFNYANIVEVRYIKRFDYSLMKPVWAPLTTEELNNTVGDGKRIICKLFKYEDRRFGIINKNKFLDLPILNEHFVINPINLILPKKPELLMESLKIKQDLDMVVARLGTELNSVLNLDNRLKRNKMAKKLDSKIDKLFVREELRDLETHIKNNKIDKEKLDLSKKLSKSKLPKPDGNF